MGISLMVSPHPSYPPLEMSRFGVKTITNTYANKDLSSFNENIVSLDVCNGETIAAKLFELAASYRPEIDLTSGEIEQEQPLTQTCKELARLL
jgi:hypothetical protein